RVSGESDLWDPRPLPPGPLDAPASAQVLDVPLQLGDPPPDVLAVHLELGLPGPPGPDATAQPRHGLPPPSEPGKEVVELGQFDLSLALPRGRMQGEDVQDQGSPVEHFRLEALFEV